MAFFSCARLLAAPSVSEVPGARPPLSDKPRAGPGRPAGDSPSGKTNSLWNRIVLIGASASAGFVASEPLGGPATLQCRLNRYLDAAIVAPHEPVRNFASSLFFIQPEAEGERQVGVAVDRHPTLVIGVDFLFWFCYGEGQTDQDRLRRFETGLRLCQEFSCPLVLGDLPDASRASEQMLSASQIPSRAALRAANQRLHAWAGSRSNVVVVGLSNFMATVVTNRALNLHGHVLAQGTTSRLLQEDGLHPSPPGCAALAVFLLNAVAPLCVEAPKIRWDPDEVFRLANSPTPRATSKEPRRPLNSRQAENK